MENTNEGIDLIQSWVTYSLYDTDGLLSLKGGNVENLRLMGAAASSINGTGNALSNVIYASAGSNVIDGAGGIDTVSYAYGLIGTSGVTVSLNNPSAQATVGSGSDRLVSIENLTGSAYADTLTGNGSANVLTGGGGKDALTGGAGNDIFDFNALTEMGTISTTRDVITDFVRGQDKIDLSTLDANTATTTNDAFSGTLVTAFTAVGQLKLLAGVLYGNMDANIATAEFAIQLTGVSSISAADFVL